MNDSRGTGGTVGRTDGTVGQADGRTCLVAQLAKCLRAEGLTGLRAGWLIEVVSCSSERGLNGLFDMDMVIIITYAYLKCLDNTHTHKHKHTYTHTHKYAQTEIEENAEQKTTLKIKNWKN